MLQQLKKVDSTARKTNFHSSFTGTKKRCFNGVSTVAKIGVPTVKKNGFSTVVSQ